MSVKHRTSEVTLEKRKLSQICNVWYCIEATKVSDYDQEIPQSQTADNLWHREE